MPQVAFKRLAAVSSLDSPEAPAFGEQLRAASSLGAFGTISAALGIEHPIRTALVKEQISERMGFL